MKRLGVPIKVRMGNREEAFYALLDTGTEGFAVGPEEVPEGPYIIMSATMAKKLLGTDNLEEIRSIFRDKVVYDGLQLAGMGGKKYCCVVLEADEVRVPYTSRDGREKVAVLKNVFNIAVCDMPQSVEGVVITKDAVDLLGFEIMKVGGRYRIIKRRLAGEYIVGGP